MTHQSASNSSVQLRPSETQLKETQIKLNGNVVYLKYLKGSSVPNDNHTNSSCSYMSQFLPFRIQNIQVTPTVSLNDGEIEWGNKLSCLHFQSSVVCQHKPTIKKKKKKKMDLHRAPGTNTGLLLWVWTEARFLWKYSANRVTEQKASLLFITAKLINIKPMKDGSPGKDAPVRKMIENSHKL